MSRAHFTFYSVPIDIALMNALASAFTQQSQNSATQENQQPQQQQTPSFNFFFVPVFGAPPTEQQPGFNFQDFLNQTFQAAQQQKTGPPPTKKDALETLATLKFTEKLEQSLRRQQQLSENACTCAVCQCDFERNDILVRLPCQHIYHKDCIEPWLKEHNTCACCRFELPVEDAKEEAERRKRMTERYTEQGFKIIEIASAVDSVCCKTEDAFDEIKALVSSSSVDEEQLRRLKHLEFELNKFDASLMQHLLSLDSIDNLTDNKLRDQKKHQIIKIQETLNALDEARKAIAERRAQETSCSSAPAVISPAANSAEDNMELC